MAKIKWSMKTVRDRCVDDGDCWIWTNALNTRNGTAQATIDGKGGVLVRRWIMEQLGKMEKNKAVINTCGNNACCNPAHLAMATKSEVLRLSYKNGARSSAKEYTARRDQAIKQGFAKIDLQKAREIRIKLADGIKAADIAKDYGICLSAVRDIKQNRSWIEQAPNASVFAWRPAA